VCQGLVQVAAGYHKLAIGNPAGARKLLDRGVRGLAASEADLDGAMRRFVARVSADLDALRLGAADLAAPPRYPVSG
jgi:hypothetical protein